MEVVVFFFTSEYIIRAAISDKIFEKHNNIYIMEILTTPVFYLQILLDKVLKEEHPRTILAMLGLICSSGF
jgi:hypothetical protein